MRGVGDSLPPRIGDLFSPRDLATGAARQRWDWAPREEQMHHERLEPELLNQIAAYVDATERDLEELHRRVHPVVFSRITKHVWSHAACLRRRLAVLEAQMHARE